MARKDPFPNDWEEVSSTDPEDFNTGTFDEVLSDVMEWYLPEPYVAVIRVYNRDTNKLKEYAYRVPAKAHERIQASALANEEVTILTPAIIGTINYELE
jgi:hypothetical protein